MGRLPYQQLLAAFQVSAVHVYLSYPYALSWSMLEAMACGAAVVGSNNPPISDVIHDHQNGRLVPFEAHDRLAAVLLDLLQDSDQRHRLGAAARHTVEQRFSLQSSVDSYERLISSLKLAATNP